MILKRFIMVWPRTAYRALIMLVMLGAIFSCMYPGLRAMAAGASPAGDDEGFQANGGDARGFMDWALKPFTAPLSAFLAIFIAGALVGAGFAYLRYHRFRLDFDHLGKLLLILMPLMAVGAAGATLVLHRYNLFLLSLYLDLPMVGAPLLYIAYEEHNAPKSDRKRL